MQLRLVFSIALVFLAISCSKTRHYHVTEKSYGKYYKELILYENGYFEYYTYQGPVDSYCGSFDDELGYVEFGRYHYDNDTLILTKQDWDCLLTDPLNDSIYLDTAKGQFIFPPEDCERSGRSAVHKYLVKGRKLKDLEYAQFTLKDDFTWDVDTTNVIYLRPGKNHGLRKADQRDSIFWDGFSSEIHPRGSWPWYPGPGVANAYRDSLVQIQR